MGGNPEANRAPAALPVPVPAARRGLIVPVRIAVAAVMTVAAAATAVDAWIAAIAKKTAARAVRRNSAAVGHVAAAIRKTISIFSI